MGRRAGYWSRAGGPGPGCFRWIALAIGLFAAAAPARSQTLHGADLHAALVDAAVERTSHSVVYDGSYRSISYPGGDVPEGTGVCTDVIIRSYRAVGIDLQQEVHEDMRAHFDLYPGNWGLSGPDANIDHRRVPNLQAFFRRKGLQLPVTADGADYLPGDLVTWTVPPNLPHIGIVIDRKSSRGGRPLIVHNIGRGPRVEDMLFRYPVTGHYRYPATEEGR